MKKRYSFKRKASKIRSYFKAKRRSTNKNRGESITGILLAGAAYGAIRAPIATAADSILSKLPLPAQLGDEVGMGILSYFAYKKGSGLVKKMGKAGLYIESYRAADTLISPMISGVIGQVTGKATNNSGYLYG